MNERELFLAALDIEDPATRQAYLQSACAGDADLRARVDSLLSSHESASQFLHVPAVEQLGNELVGETAMAPVVGDGPTNDDEPDAASSKSHRPGLMPESRNEMANEIPLGYLQPSSRSDALGRLAHYHVLEVLGHGAFGTVLKAFDEKLHRVVAIKVLAPELAATSPARKRFLREARAAAAIRHENVVSIYAVDDDPIPYLVMEYIPGETLQQRLDAQGPLELSDVLRLGRQIADGLAAAHAGHLIHRDVKPSNILLETSVADRVKITDFGLARAADDASVTQSGVIAGTPMYMAPEQALGQKLDQRADLFSLGSVLYQMACGRPPFRAATSVAVLRRVVEDTPRPLQEILPEIPDWLVGIVKRLHAKKPDDRFQSAKEVAQLLARCQVELQSTGRVTWLENVLESRTASIGTHEEPVRPGSFSIPVKCLPREKRNRRSRKTVLLALVAAILMVGAGAWLGPWLGLLVRGRAYVDCLTRDGDTRVDFYADGRLVATQVGYGGLELPAGVYELRVSKPDPSLRIYDVAVLRQNLLREYEQVNLSSPPENLRLAAGARVGFMVCYIKKETPGRIPDDSSEPGSSMSVAESHWKPAGDWISLFNGSDLAGWQNHPEEPGNWHVEDGMLTGSGQPSYLFSTRDDFADFQLRCEARINAAGDGGIIIRAPFDRPTKNGLPGYEAQLQAGAPLVEGWRTGAIGSSDSITGWRLLQTADVELPPDTWIPLEIIASGNRIETRVSGRTAAVHIDPQRLFRRGRIVLQQSGSDTRVQFRHLEVRVLAEQGK